MSVYKDAARGTWYCRFRYRDYSGKLHETTKRGFRTKREAQRYEMDYKGAAAGAAEMTMDALCDAYLADRKVNAKKSTYSALEKVIRNHIRPAFGRRIVSKITKAEVRDWENALHKKKPRYGTPYAESTLHTISAQLSTLMNYAMKYYDLQHNPVRSVGTIGSRKPRQEFWTIDQFRRFVQAIDDYPLMRMVYILLFFSGMRVGELLALTCDDVDFDKNIIHITRTALGRGMGYDTPKTPYSKRNILMPPDVMALLHEYMGSLYELPKPPEPILPVTRVMIRWNLNKYAKKAGLPHLRVHDLRHSHASYLIHHGVPITTISKRLGHANANTTLSIYAHMYAESAEDVAAMLNQTFHDEKMWSKRGQGDTKNNAGAWKFKG
jgi:integrase